MSWFSCAEINIPFQAVFSIPPQSDPAAVGSVFGDHDRRRRQFGNLVLSWFRMIEGDFFGQRSLAIRAFFGDVFDDYGDSFGRQLQTMMLSMAWLTALLGSVS